MSSSGLIYAVIVGAWAAYLVPMWLRRQDELNEARPTERFSTAIRLLSGRAGMERRYAKDQRGRTAEQPEYDVDPDAATDRLSSVDVRAFAAPRTEVRQDTAPAPARQDAPAPAERPRRSAPARPASRQNRAAAERARRSKVLARRRRTTSVLFVAFTAGAVVAAVGGLGLLWAPAVPAVLLSGYIAHLRKQERRRFAYVMDRRQAEAAAQRLREKGPRGRQSGPRAEESGGEPAPHAEPQPEPAISPQEAGRRALVEQTDHAEWVDQQRRQRGPAAGDSWDPVPVPLPTYVTAPVAPRATSGVDVSDPETWSSARSSAAEPAQRRQRQQARQDAQEQEAPPVTESPSGRRPPQQRRSRDRGRTPLFDQYADDDRPRAANE
ncbi:gephyrin-like molybdotransferase receptor GlpR [Streptomyces sp. NPDC005805]|uniref:divisome protein SepX/GlpR n=1 Tax=Streptomyces sp. NPDC005805 TaxID=3157068 RepID=UPI0033DC3077